MTVSAAVKLIPTPPALVLSKNTKISLLQEENKCYAKDKHIFLSRAVCTEKRSNKTWRDVLDKKQ